MESTRFSLVVGGPFHALLRRVGLLATDELPRPSVSLIGVLLAWGVPAALVSVQALLDAGYNGEGFFEDARAYSRWGIAIAVMIWYERNADQVFQHIIARFRADGIVNGPVEPAFTAALAAADRRTSSRLAEAAMLALAYTFSQETVELRWMLPGSDWAGTMDNGQLVLSWAGFAVTYVSDPLFAFLLLRWTWRFFVLAWMLHDISRLELRLSPLHPDGLAGLGFLAAYPTAFVGLIFALGCVVAATFHEATMMQRFTTDTIHMAMGVWILIALLIDLGPLVVFTRPLGRLKRKASERYGALAMKQHAHFHDKWLQGKDGDSRTLLTVADASSLADFNAVVDRVLAMRVLPIDRKTVTTIAAAAGLPMLPLLAAEMSVFGLIQKIGGILL